MDSRIDSILNNLLKLASGDFYIEDFEIKKNDSIDAIGSGVVMLAEQLRSTMASRDELDVLNDQKEILLKEVHHRVKNNLQIITSLLSLQSSFIEDEKIKRLFQYSQYRINSMAMIHEMLYQTEDVSKINYGDYLKELISSLIVAMKGVQNNIELKLDVPDLHLNIDTSIPLGLLTNEIVTNSLKYGFKDTAKGKITVQIERLDYPNFIMKIGDNGIGFSDEIILKKTKSLGLRLIHKLTLQLKGSIKRDNSKKGAHYIISFQEIKKSS